MKHETGLTQQQSESQNWFYTNPETGHVKSKHFKPNIKLTKQLLKSNNKNIQQLKEENKRKSEFDGRLKYLKHFVIEKSYANIITFLELCCCSLFFVDIHQFSSLSKYKKQNQASV